MLSSLSGLVFDNSYASLPEAFYSALAPSGLDSPHLVAFSPDAAALIDLAPEAGADPLLVEIVGGTTTLPGMQPVAMVYAGHQFGSYNPRLGDGRGLLLGEVLNRRGERWDLHLKGAGQTPYSRFGDGRAVVRSCIREYLCSEAMAGLGIPTTRALAVVGSATPVVRETVERGAALLRLAQSHVRFGHFEFFAYTGQGEALGQLVDYVIARHYPEARDSREPIATFFRLVVERTARTVAAWQAVGFTHGVMNTDNMSIIGDTFDYGPFGLLDSFRAGHVPNHSDETGRYAFDQQPSIALWNCWCLARALSSLVDKEALEAGLGAFEPTFMAAYAGALREKFGLARTEEDDRDLILAALALLEQQDADYTVFMRRLGDFAVGGDNSAIRQLFAEPEAFDVWAVRYAERLRRESRSDEDRRMAMCRVNPKFILRQHLAQEAIRMAEQEGDFSEIERLRQVLSHPFDEQPEWQAYADAPPASSRQIVVSCSS